jgi:integrase
MRRPSLKISKSRDTETRATHRWRIEGHRENGKRKRLFFATRQEAEIVLARLKHTKAKEGEDAARLDMTQRADAVRALGILSPLNVSLESAARFYADHRAALDRSRPVAEVVREVLDTKKRDGASPSHLQTMRLILEKFSRSFPGKAVAEVESVQVDDWLRSLPCGPTTRNGYRRYLVLFFNYAENRGYCDSNPVTKTAKAKQVASPPSIFSPEETSRILTAARNTAPETLPFFAISFFAGVRVAEVHRLDWKEVKIERRFIEVGAAKSKTASRRLVHIEDNLAAWLAPYARKSGTICGPNFRKLFDKVRTAAGVEWKDNGMRHSFASYHLARGQDAAATAMQLGHPNTNMLYAHYRELVTQEDAARFFAIVPDAGASNVIPLAVAS